MARKYHTLISKRHGLWVIEFGDYDKQTVVDEMCDHRDHEPKLPMRIITTGDRQVDIDTAVKALNHV